MADRHGKWWDRLKGPVGQIMEGRFTRLFPELDGAVFADGDMQKLADAMTSPAEASPTPEGTADAEENHGIVAGYTYLGQFIDHDLTFDPTSSLKQFLTSEQLRQLVDFRTPRFDLDNLYGHGPNDNPYMYESDGIHLVVGDPMSGNPHDPGAVGLPRAANGRAIIGDPRNDENRIVSQLHATMLRFHNKVADAMPDADFETVRSAVRWHYQWIVVNDFLPTVINAGTVQRVFPHLGNGGSIAEHPPRFSISKLEIQQRLELMPVEFSVAAYRFGHSMIRPIYRLNETISRMPIFSREDARAGDLGGFRPVPSDWAIDWQFFIDIERATPPQPDPNPRDAITRTPQFSYKIDSSLVNPLAFLPAVVATNPSSLTLRNLLRGRDFELPSGQAVARSLGLAVIPDAELVIGKATADPTDPKLPIAEIAADFAGNAPLWAYVLAESQVTSLNRPHPGITDPDLIPIQLGPVGGTIIAEVFAALLLGDRTSYLRANPGFTPNPAFTHNGEFGFVELINVALGRQP
ncbi:MAG TPA: heme peroxidase family protein [Solirubrobacteraceae bacterium]